MMESLWHLRRWFGTNVLILCSVCVNLVGIWIGRFILCTRFPFLSDPLVTLAEKSIHLKNLRESIQLQNSSSFHSFSVVNVTSLRNRHFCSSILTKMLRRAFQFRRDKHKASCRAPPAPELSQLLQPPRPTPLSPVLTL